MSALGMLHTDGLTRDGIVLVKRDRALARRLYVKASDLGDPWAMTLIAGSLTSSTRVPREAVRLFSRAFRAGYSTAAYNLANAYQNIGSWRSAVAWYKKALGAGEVSALLQIAHAEMFGLGTRQNIPSAMKRLEQLANPRRRRWRDFSSDAMVVMAQVLIDGWPVKRNFREGIRLLRHAARLDNDLAKRLLEHFE